MRSSDAAAWNVPLVPSGQELRMVLGWFGSTPPANVSRLMTRVPVSHDEPGRLHPGALSVASYTACVKTARCSMRSLVVVLPPTTTAEADPSMYSAADA